MKARFIPALCAAGLLALGGAFAAEKEKSANAAAYPFWTAPKRGPVTDFVPGLHAVLGLTDAQKTQIAAASEEIMSDPTVQAARGISKNDPSITPEQRDAARATLQAATDRLRARVGSFLTVEQTAMIENINGAYAAATQEVGATYAERVGAAKIVGEERLKMQQQQRDEIQALFGRKLDEMLTPEQKSAMAAETSKIAQNKPEKK